MKKLIFTLIAMITFINVSLAQNHFEGTIVFTSNTIATGVMKNAYVNGITEELVYVKHNKYLLFNTTSNLVNLIDVDKGYIYFISPELKIMHMQEIEPFIAQAQQNLELTNGAYNNLHPTSETKEIHGFMCTKNMIDTTAEAAGVTSSNKTVQWVTPNLLNEELMEAYRALLATEDFVTQADVEMSATSALFKGTLNMHRYITSVDRNAPSDDKFKIPDDVQIVTSKEFQKEFNKHQKKLNKEREKAGEHVEYHIPDDIWEF
ncbi:MAG: hypothetical protein PHR53_03785 [Bacteroidales bacterium]|nr:hypothetical protein [Bacteroidales bacterium]